MVGPRVTAAVDRSNVVSLFGTDKGGPGAGIFLSRRHRRRGGLHLFGVRVAILQETIGKKIGRRHANIFESKAEMWNSFRHRGLGGFSEQATLARRRDEYQGTFAGAQVLPDRP